MLTIHSKTLDGISIQYNASTYWLIGDALLFYQSGLDPNATHEITLTHMGNAPYFALSLNRFTVYQPNSTNQDARYVQLQ